ncbi:polar amino acid transport system substrate-binding protein [Pseudomonas nitritireducens]|uniref:Polar amino acid transport system substrate-binding protein n=1 Tax=Pseudomonas nitroreducens TaxID=46680 RepID=A0A7W7NZJ7_PSENT|nr:transporter substrate-binding domain-containing protein [Pseudomonas nitritireducens]MBB4862581.1 polar amino acid transport system substrate-binding protein [Pseudomonas nitritireducens]
MALYRRLFSLLVLAPAAWLCAEAMAEDRLGCDTPIRLAFYRNPLVFQDGHGIDPDVVAELARRTGCQFQLSVMPRTDIWKALQDGDLDMATSGISSPERRTIAFFIPYLYLRNKLILPRQLGEDMNTLEDFHDMPGARIGVIAGYRHGAYIDSMLRMLRVEGRVREYPDDAARFSALLNGEIEGVIGHEMNLRLAVVDPQQRSLFRVIDVTPGPAVGLGLVLGRKRFTPAQGAQWQGVIDALWVDGGLQRIMNHNAPAPLAAEFLDSGYRFGSTDRGW